MPILKKVWDYCEKLYKIDKLNYTILIIITDGYFFDLLDSIDFIVSMSNLPLSIVIIGIGDDDFKDM